MNQLQTPPLAEGENVILSILMAAGAVGIVIYLAVLVLMIVSWWKIFEKAGKPGWAAIVPIYQWIVLLEICGRPIIWIIWLLIPCSAPVVAIILIFDLAKVFGRSGLFAVGLLLLSIIFIPVLAFGSSKYHPPMAPAPTGIK